MKNTRWISGGAIASLLAFGAAEASPLTVSDPQLTAALTGSAAGVALTGDVDVQVESAKSALVRIANTTAAKKLSKPVITRVGFALEGVPYASCLQLEDPSNRFSLNGKKVTPFCGVGGGQAKKGCGSSKWDKLWAKLHKLKKKKGGKLGKLLAKLAGGKQTQQQSQAANAFTYALEAKAPSPWKGVQSGEELVLRLVVSPSCDYDLSPEAFLLAEGVGAEEHQWAAKFQSVGKWGKGSGCAFGSSEDLRDADQDCRPIYTWSEFIATSSDLNQLPSLFADSDSRGGSVEYNFNGDFAFNGVSNEAPFDAAILTLRSGEPKLLEQWQFNRTNTPAVLDADQCSIGSPFSQCWIFDPGDTQDDVLAAFVPTNTASSNQGFDESGLRVEIAGGIEIEYTQELVEDNGHQRMLVEWHAPLGLETAQLLLRGRYDWDLNNLGATDPFVPLFHRNIAALGPDDAHPSVEIIEETATTLRLLVNVQDATVAVCEDYVEQGLITPAGGPLN